MERQIKIIWEATAGDAHGYRAFLGVSKRKNDFIILTQDVNMDIRIVETIGGSRKQALDLIDSLYCDDWDLEWLDEPEIEKFDYIPYDVIKTT